MKDVFLTKDGIEKLQHELRQLIEIERKEIIKKIKETREYGDLSENAEYDAARTQQSMIEGRIEELEALLKKARVISHAKHSGGKVIMGDKGENTGLKRPPPARTDEPFISRTRQHCRSHRSHPYRNPRRSSK